jgi:hypothetical protein
MNKTLIVGCFIFALLAIIILVGYVGSDMRSKEALNSLSKLTERENFDDLSLTIYYMNPYIFTFYQVSVDDLINSKGIKIIVDGSDVEEHIDLFKQISKDDLIPVKKTSGIDARVYYVFESEKEGKMLEVAMWGDNNSVFINGLEVKGNNIFFTFIIPFLPEDEKIDGRHIRYEQF